MLVGEIGEFYRVCKSCCGDGQLVLEEDVGHKYVRCFEQLSWIYIATCVLTNCVSSCGFLFIFGPG